MFVLWTFSLCVITPDTHCRHPHVLSEDFHGSGGTPSIKSLKGNTSPTHTLGVHSCTEAMLLRLRLCTFLRNSRLFTFAHALPLWTCNPGALRGAHVGILKSSASLMPLTCARGWIDPAVQGSPRHARHSTWEAVAWSAAGVNVTVAFSAPIIFGTSHCVASSRGTDTMIFPVDELKVTPPSCPHFGCLQLAR